MWYAISTWRKDNLRPSPLGNHQGNVSLVPKDTWAGPAHSQHISQCSKKGFLVCC